MSQPTRSCPPCTRCAPRARGKSSALCCIAFRGNPPVGRLSLRGGRRFFERLPAARRGPRASYVGGASACFRGGVGYADGLHLSPDAMPHLVELLEPFLEDVQPRVSRTSSSPDSVASRGRLCGLQRLRPVLCPRHG